MNKRKIVAVLGFLVYSLVFAACKKADIDGNPRVDPQLAAELRSSPTEVIVGSHHYLGIGGITIDMIPGAGQPIKSLTGIIEKDSLSIPSSVQLKRQYVIHGEEVWVVDYLRHNENLPEYVLLGIAHTTPDPDRTENTPVYKKGDVIDIVCAFEDAGKLYYVLTKNSRVEITH